MRARLASAALLLAACGGLYGSTPGPHSDPQGVQLPLGGDRVCSDPIFRQTAVQCCEDHDSAYWVGGTEQDFHLANAEFLACMLLWGVPPEIAELRWRAVERFGWSSWRETKERTRGPPR